MSHPHRSSLSSREHLVRGIAGACVFVAATMLACSESTTEPPDLSGTFYGGATTMAGGSGRAYVTLDAAGTPTELGLALTESALDGLPAAKAEFVFTMPSEASATAYQHAAINWAPTGHEPTAYMVPHFDVHFYMISSQARDAITSADPGYATKLALQPTASFLPAGYAIGMPMERMGMHWRDPASPELSGAPFTSTFIYGSYDGRIVFGEPMIAKSYLDSKPALVVRPLKLPQQYSTTGHQATAYSTVYDATKKEFRIALVNLVRVVASASASRAAP
ncbi:MAG TPA: DUF5602 domain-containing protein [Gemmatimonadaceae bacterium]|nr:DUF5602 domain-containing protein [Gemmatimonadaceae bacterium]